MMTLLAILIPLCTGLLISAALIVEDGGWKERPLVIFTAPPVGIALTSGLYFFWILALRPETAMPFFLALEGALLLLAGWFYGRRHGFHFKLARAAWRGSPTGAARRAPLRERQGRPGPESPNGIS